MIIGGEDGGVMGLVSEANWAVGWLRICRACIFLPFWITPELKPLEQAAQWKRDPHVTCQCQVILQLHSQFGGKARKSPRDGFFLRAESFFNVATEIEKLDSEPGTGPPIGPSYGDRALHEQSHGESFLALLVNRFHGDGLYLLDEPEAALSPSRQLAVITRIYDLVQENSQFIIATHSPIIMAYPTRSFMRSRARG